MRTLYHYPLCPFSRKIRFLLAEKKLDYVPEVHRFWEKRPEFLRLNPLGKVPVLVELNGSVIADSMAIAEYLEESYPDISLLGEGGLQRAEVRRLSAWFDDSFAQQVTLCILFEKNIKRYVKTDSLPSGPNSHVIRSAKNAIHYHLDYISWLVDRRNWLAGNNFTLADITVASHISVVDYMGDVPWDKHPLAKDWYARVKSRPTFRFFLQDRVPGLTPSASYIDLDF